MTLPRFSRQRREGAAPAKASPPGVLAFATGLHHASTVFTTIEAALTAVHNPSGYTVGPGICEASMDATILVVDDDPTIRTLLTRVLTRVGYQVQEADDGLSALEQIARCRPDLVLTDLMMPGMKGDALVAQVMQRLDPIPCIIMSAYHEDPPLAHVPFLSKPFAIPVLVALVATALCHA